MLFALQLVNNEQIHTMLHLVAYKSKWPLIAIFHIFWFCTSTLVAQDSPKSSLPLLLAGIDCIDEEDFPLAIDILTQSVSAAKRENNPAMELKGHYHLALSKFWLSNYEGSNASLDTLLYQFHAMLNRRDSLKIFQVASQNYFYMGNYDMAHEIALERLKLTEKALDSSDLATSYQVIAEIECRQKNYAGAFKNVQVALAIFENLGDSFAYSFNLDLLGDIYHNSGSYRAALSSKIKSCQVIDTSGHLYDNAYCDHTIALTLTKLGNYDKAIPLFRKSLANWNYAKMQEEAALTKACLGEALAASGKQSEGMALLKEGMQMAESLGVNPLRRDIYEKIFQTSKHCGYTEQALVFLEKYHLLNDSLNNQNARVRIASLSNNYQLGKKNAELEALKNAEKIKAKYIQYLSAGMLVLACLAAFSYYMFKKQRRYSKKLRAQSAQINQQYNDLHNANEKLIRANQDLEQFAYLASHDLKAPLRNISNYAALIAKRYSSQLDENGTLFLGFIVESAEHMNLLLEDIFNYSKVGNDEPKSSQVNLHEKLQLALRLLNETIESKQAKVTFDQLPTVMGNPTQLYQVIQNLLDNALKFIPKDRQPHLEIRLAEEGDEYRISVQDNGIGIPDNKKEEVFTIFKRLHTKEEYKGTGIGLAICKKIVETHGGRIWIESDGKMGTSFNFTLNKMNGYAQGLKH
jgi:signal transduction histidine kinase